MRMHADASASACGCLALSNKMALADQETDPAKPKVEITKIKLAPQQPPIKWSRIPQSISPSLSERSNNALVSPISYLDLSDESDCSPTTNFDDDGSDSSCSSTMGLAQRNLLNVLGNETKTFREIMLVTCAVFQGYGILVLFQNKLAQEIGIIGDNDPRSGQFHFAVSFLYIGNLLFRVLHNLVFSWIRPRFRVYLSMICMMSSMFIISILIFVFHFHQMFLIYLSYILGGIAVGTFEANLISSITLLGSNTKVWAITGLPLGFASVSVLGFLLTSVGVPVIAIYIEVWISLACGAAVFFWRIPAFEIKNNATTFGVFLNNMKAFRLWMPSISVYSLALMLDMCVLSLFSGLMLYIFNDSEVPLFGVNGSVTLRHDLYFAMFNLCATFGDSLSRKLAYDFRPRHPFLYLLLSPIGAVLCISKIAILGWLGVFLIFFANGFIYALTTRHIDSAVRHEFNLVALSIWLFIGDIGSVAGSNIIGIIEHFACDDVHSQHVCLL
uniref:Transmembrane protein n=2 Tax=Hirondellea gigas TaxID=1518452 RepID=A0A6A7G760_9CRUS